MNGSSKNLPIHPRPRHTLLLHLPERSHAIRFQGPRAGRLPRVPRPGHAHEVRDSAAGELVAETMERVECTGEHCGKEALEQCAVLCAVDEGGWLCGCSR